MPPEPRRRGCRRILRGSEDDSPEWIPNTKGQPSLGLEGSEEMWMSGTEVTGSTMEPEGRQGVGKGGRKGEVERE
jgi:hypothetical protein